MAGQIVQIASEEDAWRHLEEAVSGKFPQMKGTDLEIQFHGWPRLEIYLPDTPRQASISPSMMEAFIDLQKTIYRSHTFLSADTGNLRTLTNAEREQFEFRVEVKPGSSGYEVDLTEIAKSLGADIIAKKRASAPPGCPLLRC